MLAPFPACSLNHIRGPEGIPCDSASSEHALASQQHPTTVSRAAEKLACEPSPTQRQQRRPAAGQKQHTRRQQDAGARPVRPVCGEGEAGEPLEQRDLQAVAGFHEQPVGGLDAGVKAHAFLRPRWTCRLG